MRARGGYPNPTSLAGSELSMGWVDPWVGSGWVEIFQFLVGWVGSTRAKVQQNWKNYVNAFKTRQIRFGCTKQLNCLLCWVASGWVQIFPLVAWVGFGQSAFRQPPPTCRTTFPAQHLRPSGVFSCWPDGLELTPGFYLGSNEQHRLFWAST